MGQKMSKSLGNGIDADSVLECGAGGRTGSWKVRGPDGSVSLKANKIGSECFRLWKACEAQVGDDFHINPEEIESKYFGVLTKIFNIARFAASLIVQMRNHLHRIQLKIVGFNRVRNHDGKCTNILGKPRYLHCYSGSQDIRNWILPSHWLEMAKSRLYDGDQHAAWTIHNILRDFLAAFSPVCPFFATTFR